MRLILLTVSYVLLETSPVFSSYCNANSTANNVNGDC